MHQCQADAEAMPSVTPARAIGCARATSGEWGPAKGPAPPKHMKSESSCLSRSRADASAAGSVTPVRAISCARAEHGAPAGADQAREREAQHASMPIRRRRGAERHAARAIRFLMRKGRAASEFLRVQSRTANPLPVGIHSTVRIANYYNRQNRHGLVACHLLVSDASVTRTCVQPD